MANSLLSIMQRGLKAMGLPMGGAVAGSRFGYGGRSWFYGLLPGAKKDFVRLAGDRWKNTIVAASLSWIARNSPQAPPCVYIEDADGEEKIVPGHPLTAVLKKPNKYYDWRTLRQATFLSLIAGGGNAYWWVKRDRIGRPIELWYLPHFDCWPVWLPTSTTDNWIEGYQYRQNGVTYNLKNEEVIHFRDGLDPENQRSGMDYLRTSARQIVTDNDAAGFAAALLENMCIPGAIISPAGDMTIEQGDADEIKARFVEETGGDNRFMPLIMPSGVKVDKLTFTPEEMALHTMQDRPEATICAIIGIHPAVLGLMVGLDKGMAYASMDVAERSAWYNCIIPRLNLMDSELDTQLLAFYPGSENMRCGFDDRKVPALQDNLDNKYKRLSDAVGGPFLTPDEARMELGKQKITGGDVLYRPKGAAAPGADGGSDNQKSFELKRAASSGSHWVTIDGNHVEIGSDGQPTDPKWRARLADKSPKPAGVGVRHIEHTYSQGDKFFEKHDVADVTPSERKSIKGYALGDFSPINRALRNDKPVPSYLRNDAENLDAVLKRSKIPENVVLRRGIQYDDVADLDNMESGDEIEEKGFASTSLSNAFEGNVQLKIKANKGQSGIMIEHYTGNKEHEILLPRGSMYKINHVKKETDPFGKTTYHVSASLMD